MRTTGRVLVVDDYEPNVAGLRLMLECAGHNVLTASNGHDALHLIKQHRPDVVLLDVIMPGMSGLDVCAAMKQDETTRLTPVVLISAAQVRDTRVAGLDAGADDFLNKPIDPEELQARVCSLIRLKRTTDELESAESLFVALGRVIEARDPYTEGHCERLAEYATALGRVLRLPQSDLDALYRGAFLHDIGKIAIPDRILQKKGKLTRAEYLLMKQHPIIGDELCRTVKSLDDVRAIVRSHHERFDGTGYPDKLAGDDIPLLARVVSVVDMFDALTTDRTYRKAMTSAAAYKVMVDEARKGWREPILVDTFIDLHRELARQRAAS